MTEKKQGVRILTGLCIGIDIGTSNMTAYVEGKGIVFSRPSVIACDAYNGRILALGESAFAMTGRTPGSIEVIHPFSDGVVSDMGKTVAMISDFVDKVCSFTVLKPNIIASVPSDITSLEKKAILDVLEMAGAGKVCIMEQAYAAAVGADVVFAKPYGTMIVDIGGGTVDIAVVTMGSIAESKTIRVASEAFTQDIIRYLRRERDIEVGYLTAENHIDYLPKVVISTIKNTLDAFETRISKILFKSNVELSNLTQVTAATVDTSELNLSRVRANSVRYVQQTHGFISLAEAVKLYEEDK